MPKSFPNLFEDTTECDTSIMEMDTSPEYLYSLIQKKKPLPKLSYEHRNLFAAYLRLHGWSYPEIQKKLRITDAKKICDTYIQSCSKDRLFDILDSDICKLDLLYKKAVERIEREGSVAINSAVKILERKEKLLGLEGTIKSILADPDKSVHAEHLLMMGLTSGQKEVDENALERYRNAQAEIAELKLAKEKQHLIPKETVEQSMNVLGNQIRKSQELLTKRFGEDAGQILQDAIEAINQLNTEEVENHDTL
jgi:hypothetical protein